MNGEFGGLGPKINAPLSVHCKSMNHKSKLNTQLRVIFLIMEIIHSKRYSRKTTNTLYLGKLLNSMNNKMMSIKQNKTKRIKLTSAKSEKVAQVEKKHQNNNKN